MIQFILHHYKGFFIIFFLFDNATNYFLTFFKLTKNYSGILFPK